MCVLKVKEESVMRVLFKLSAWVGKGYAYPSQRKIAKLSQKWFSVPMSRRTLCRVSSSLQVEGYIRKVSRHRRGPGGNMIFKSTLYVLQGRAFNWAYGLGAWSRRLFEVFRVPKMAQYKSSTANDLTRCGKVGSLVTLVLDGGGARGAP